jgi:amino acid transporter
MGQRQSPSPTRYRFGTFAGVFTPTVLTILGIILFLRLGWVVGQAGLWGSLIIIGLSCLISLVTGLSLSAVATNIPVKAGGVYYMISRTMGLEIGGAIGIPLYLSQAVSVAFYIIGFSEAFQSILPSVDPRLTSTAVALCFGLLAYLGADFVVKIQFGILGLIALALLSFFAGGGGFTVTPHWFAPPAATAGFWRVFAIFFPAVTGITVGVSMSGDLKNPAASITRGTLAAIGVTSVVYLAVAVWLATHAPAERLIADNMIMSGLSRWPVLILLGIWASTLSSALGSILAAPRTLQAVALDRVVPRLLGRGLGSPTEPRLAVMLTTAIALIVIWMGDLDFVAPIITMFFLNTYGMINLTAGIERLVGNPSFRPRVRLPWYVSVLGALGCYGAMFLIDAVASVVAILVSYGFFFLLSRRALRQDWGDVRGGIWFTLARFGLIRLEQRPAHPKNWRPNIVAFSRMPQWAGSAIITLCAWLSLGRGLVTVCHLLVGDVDELAGRDLRQTARRELFKHLQQAGGIAFAQCSLIDDFESGVVSAVQASGAPGPEPNTALMYWSREADRQLDQLRLMRRLIALRKSVMFLHVHPERGFGDRKRIDVWWRGRDRNGELMLLLAHIITRSPDWNGARIRVLRLIDREEGRQGAETGINRLLEEVRMEAEGVILVKPGPDASFASILEKASAESDLVLVGQKVPEEAEIQEQARFINNIIALGGTMLLVRSGETGDILDPGVEP